VVEVPSPWSGRIARVFGNKGDLVKVGAPLVEFAEGAEQDTGTVVGQLDTGEKQAAVAERPAGSAPARMLQVLPAVRALAHKLDVDLNAVQATGPGGTITRADVERAAKSLAEAGPAEALRGMRRAMAQRMAAAHAEVVPATVTDDAEMHFPKEGVVLSRESRSSEKFMHGIKVLMAKNYIDNLSEEARKGMQEKAEQGIWPTKTPLGYRNGLAFVGTLRVVGGRRTACPRFAIWVPSGSGKLKQLEYGAKLTQSGGGRIVGQMVWRTTATSASGTFETGLWTPKTSACRGRPEVIGGRSKRRD
jgi:hypothetical protein